jgi:hypothetical protein
VSANLAGFFPTPLVDNNGQNWDIMVVAHELGHNFGAPHTHNYNPPLDGCGLSPSDCTVANQDAGTIMSYCHLCAGGVQNIKLQFHPANIATMEQHLASSSCQYTGPARPPLAFIDRVQVPATVPTLIDVLANEIEFNCEAVSIEFPTNPTANGGQLSVSAGTGPGGRDQVLYLMPTPGFTGNDTFTYRLRDTSGDTVVAGVVPTVSPVRVPENPVGATPQLEARYYALPALSALPDFTVLSPYLTASAAQVDFASTAGNFAASGRADDVGAVFSEGAYDEEVPILRCVRKRRRAVVCARIHGRARREKFAHDEHAPLRARAGQDRAALRGLAVDVCADRAPCG